MCVSLLILEGVNVGGVIANRKFELIGKEFETNNCGKCTVIDYKGAYSVTVIFHKPIFVTICTMSSLKTGRVLNPFSPRVYGVGYLGVGDYDSDDDSYSQWKDMLKRCYCEKHKSKHTSYEDVTVCEEWLNFQNFAKWCHSQEFFQSKDDDGRFYRLDKDILIKGNKTYSPETCCFVPMRINNLILTSLSSRGSLPIGVTKFKRDSNYVVKIRKGAPLANHIGYFNTPEEAFQAYKKAKEDYIKAVAEDWKDRIDDKTYIALLGWNIEITD